MTGYDIVRNMNDAQMTEYFRKFAEFYFKDGMRMAKFDLNPITDNKTYEYIKYKGYLKGIGNHSNSI